MAGIAHDRRVDRNRPAITVAGLRHVADRLGAAIQNRFVAERTRWVLCVPVLLGIGIASYFSLADEPQTWLGPGLVVAALVLVVVLRRHQITLALACLAFLVALGFGAAQMRTLAIDAPILDRKLGPVSVIGNLARIEARPNGSRLWINKPVIDRLSPENTPIKIRITVAKPLRHLSPGDRIKVRAVLHPPAGPAAPKAFDFARQAYFLQLGAVGYAVQSPALIRKAAVTGFTVRLATLRQYLTGRIHGALPGTTGTIAAALMTGERGAIPQDVLTAIRESGLAHLLAISGLHIGLIAGLLFFSLRLCLAIRERTALRQPIKKWAAVAALLGSLGYLLISGSTLPTQRAFMMLCFVMLAILIDRSAISMNLVAWAATVILLIAPESLMNVSFQMSFAAVTALVAVYEYSLVRRMTGKRESKSKRAMLYFSAVLLTTLVAGLATAPFALYHFNQIALYGLLANALAVPLTALWIMPCAILGFLLMPVGLEHWPLIPMGWGIDGVVAIAFFVQALPGSIAALPAMPSWALGFIVAGGLWLCLWLTAWRFCGLIAVAIGLVGIGSVQTPDILISETGKMVAIKQGEDRLAFVFPPRGFVAETWLRRSGQRVFPGRAGDALAPRATGTRCDGLGCVIRSKGHVIAVVHDVAALSDDCARATLILSRVPVKRTHCPRPEKIVDRFALWRNGAHALWLTTHNVRVESVASVGGRRPWSRYPRTVRKNQ